MYSITILINYKYWISEEIEILIKINILHNHKKEINNEFTGSKG